MSIIDRKKAVTKKSSLNVEKMGNFEFEFSNVWYWVGRNGLDSPKSLKMEMSPSERIFACVKRSLLSFFEALVTITTEVLLISMLFISRNKMGDLLIALPTKSIPTPVPLVRWIMFSRLDPIKVNSMREDFLSSPGTSRA